MSDYAVIAKAGITLIDGHLDSLVMDTDEDNALLAQLRETWELAKTAGADQVAPERLMVRKLYYLMCDLIDHIESDTDFRPANRDDYRQDFATARVLIREVRENGWQRS